MARITACHHWALLPKAGVMRSSLLPVAALFAALLSFTATGRAEEGGALMRVEQATRSDMNPKNRLNRVHSRTLVVFVTNNSGEELQLKVKHIVFGRSLFNHDLVTVGQGERPVAVKPHSTERVETTEAKVIGSEQHWDAKAKKMIDASGANIIGAGVQLLLKDKVIAEWYDPESIKGQWGKTIELKPVVPVKK
jgi:hypothetical protein